MLFFRSRRTGDEMSGHVKAREDTKKEDTKKEDTKNTRHKKHETPRQHWGEQKRWKTTKVSQRTP